MENLSVRAAEYLEKHNVTPAEPTIEEMYQDPETGVWMYSDAAALQLVIEDAAQSDNYANINQWASQWTMSDLILQSPQNASAFDGGNVAQANVPKYTLSNHLSAITPKIMGGLFFEDPPFLLRPRPGTTQEITLAKTALFSAQLWDMKFEEEVEYGLEQMALLGTTIFKWGYSEKDKKVKAVRRKQVPAQLSALGGAVTQDIDTPDSDDFEVYTDTIKVSRPWIRYCDIRTVLVDPGCRVGDIRRAKWVIYRDYVTYDTLNDLRKVPGYNIPPEKTLRDIFLARPTSGMDNISMTIPEGMRGYLQHALPRNFKTSADKLQLPMELLERWDKDRVIVVLVFGGHNILIRNEVNPYGCLPFFSANWRNLPDSFYGQGLGQLIGPEQVVEQGVTNLALDLLAYGLQPTAIRKKGWNVPTQFTRWKQGGIIDVDDDVDKSFKFLEMPGVPAEAWQAISQAKQAAEATSGANENFVQGASSMGGRATGARTATGAAGVIAANASRLDGPTERLVRQVFVPWLYQMDELNNQLLPTSVLRQVLGEEMGQEYKGDHIKFRQARFEYEVLAGAHLGAKKEMSQALPIIIELINNPTFSKNLNDAGYTWDAYAVFRMFTDAAGWKFSQDFVKKMNPQQLKQYQENQPAQLQQRQLQAQQAMQTQKFQQEKELEDQKQLGKAGAEVLRSATEHSLGQLETGEPSNSPQSFGAETTL